MISDNVKLLQDKNKTITIMNNEENILLADSDRAYREKFWRKSIMAKRDSLLANRQRVTCLPVDQEGVADMKVILRLNQKAQRSFQVKKMTIWLSRAQSRIRKMKLDYTRAHQLATMTYKLVEMDVSYSTDRLTSPIDEVIYNAEGQLTKKYRSYKMKDVRTGKRQSNQNP
jgi:hypothetical protein